MKKLFKIAPVALVSAFTIFVMGCNDNTATEALVIERQGVFASGGSVTEPIPGEFNVTENWMDFSRVGNTAHVDHANTFFQIPAGENRSPIVYLHGYGQTRTG